MIIVKIGGGEGINLNGVISDLATLEESFLIIHGANAFRDQLAIKLKKTKQEITSVSGKTSVFSDESMIDLMMMAYAGYKNKRIVELCQQKGINAVGLSGLDGKVIQGKRNRGIKVKVGEKILLKKDFSGKPQRINQALLTLLLNNGYTPVLCVPIIDENNLAINSENDDIVAVLQQNLPADRVISLIEEPGFLENKADPSSLVRKMSRTELAERTEQVSGRMQRKMLALGKLFTEGMNPTVYLSDGRVEHPIKDALAGKGTTIQ